MKKKLFYLLVIFEGDCYWEFWKVDKMLRIFHLSIKFQTTIPNIQIVYIRAEVSRKSTYYAYT